MRIHRLVVFAVSLGVVVSLPHLLLCRLPGGEAAQTTAKAMVSILGFNSSQQVLYDYVAGMDLAAIEALADAHRADLIPQQELLPQLPGPLPGWTYLLFGDSYFSNATDANALGMYAKGALMATEEIAYVTISHRVGGYEFTWDPMVVQGILGFDAGYPKDVSVQGYPGMEWRATGDNLGDVTDFEGHLESFSGLWVRIGGTAVIPEAGLLVLALPIIVLVRGGRTAPR